MVKRALLIVLFFSLFLGVSPKVAAAGNAWAVIDADTGRLLDGYNETVQLPIASLTKVWTAFTFIESGVAAGEVTISPKRHWRKGLRYICSKV